MLKIRGRLDAADAVDAVFSQTAFVTYFHAALTSLACNIYVDLFTNIIEQNNHLFSFYWPLPTIN